MRRPSVRAYAFLLASLPFTARALADQDLRVSGPVVHDNLAIYLVHGSGFGGAAPLTLQEALAKGTVKVRETGSVNELTLENLGAEEVFVQAGDIVKGGRQDRVLSVDLLLPPGVGEVSIAAFCIEPGRWTGRGHEDPTQFSSAASAMPSHEAKMTMREYMMSALSTVPVVGDVARSMTASAGTGARQQEIWATVSKAQRNLGGSLGESVEAQASPSSLQLSLENEKLKEVQAAYVSALRSSGESDGDIVGYVFAVNGKINSGDIYASHALFRKMWPKLLDASITEAISTRDASGAAVPTAQDIQAFLARAITGKMTERAINPSVRVAMLDGASSFFTETRRADGSWVHRNYLAK